MDAAVVICYEAGRDGFWLHRALSALGVTNLVVDSSSIEVTRRAKQAKSDRLDTTALLAKLARHVRGDRDVWSVVHVHILRRHAKACKRSAVIVRSPEIRPAPTRDPATP